MSMQPATWYYCNVIDTSETSWVVPIAQDYRRADRVATKALVERSLTFDDVPVDDELAVPRSTFVLAAATSDSLRLKGACDTEEGETKSEWVATEVVAEGGGVVLETEAAGLIEKETIVQLVTVEEEEVVGQATSTVEVEQEVVEVVEVVAAVKNEDVAVVQTVEKEVRTTSEEGAVTKGKMEEEVVEVVGVSVAANLPVEGEEFKTAIQLESYEASAVEAVESTCAAMVNEDPNSEIEETMVIDRDVAATEAADSKARSSSLSCIPDHIRNNSYAVSSVAVAVAAAVAATLLARR